MQPVLGSRDAPAALVDSQTLRVALEALVLAVQRYTAGTGPWDDVKAVSDRAGAVLCQLPPAEPPGGAPVRDP